MKQVLADGNYKPQTTVTPTGMDIFAVTGSAFLGYKYGDMLLPGVGGIWGGVMAGIMGGGLMSSLLGTDFGNQWLANVNLAVTAMINSPVQALAVWFTALVLFDSAWDYAFELFDPVFDIVFEFIPGGGMLMTELNPFSGGFLGASAIAATLLTVGAYDYIGWPMSCAMWSLCVLSGQDGGGSCSGGGAANQWPCPGGFVSYECPDQFPMFRGDYHQGYNGSKLLGDIAHMALIPVAMPLCLAIQFLKGLDGTTCKQTPDFPSVLSIMMLPVEMLQQFMYISGVLMLDIAYFNNNLFNVPDMISHMVNELKCDSFNLGYCG